MLPVRNGGANLRDCLDSIAAQTFQLFEAVIIDDGSEDGSREVIDAYAREWRAARVLTPGRVGLVAALNLGIEEAAAPLVARMDADDVMDPRRLEIQIAAFERDSELGVFGTRVALISDDKILAGYAEYVRWQNSICTAAEVATNIYVESPFAHPSVMFRREAVMDAGGYRDGDFPEDYDLWLRLHAAGAKMEKSEEVLLRWRDGRSRTSRTDPRYAREAFDRLRAEYLSRDPRVISGRPLVIWGSGRKTRLRTRHLLQRGVRPAAYVDIDDDKIGRSIERIPVVGPEWVRQKRPFVLIYVASHGAREEIAARVEAMGYQVGEDYLAVG